MKQLIQIPLFSFILLFFTFVFSGDSYAGNVLYTEESNIFLSSSDITLVAETNSSVDSITVAENSFTVTVSTPDSFTVRSNNKYELSNNANIPVSCDGGVSRLTIQPQTDSFTVVVTPTTNEATCPTSDNNPAPNSNSIAYTCARPAPGAKVPWLYAASSPNSQSVRLYFAQADDPFDHYELEYGTESGKYTFGSLNIGGKDTRTYLVQDLSSNTGYYFRVRAGNGCAAGEWSNEIFVRTKNRITFNQLGIANSELKTFSTSEVGSEQPQDLSSFSKTYTVTVKVMNQNNEPLRGAKVTLHSKIQEGITNDEGAITFAQVEPGDHKVFITYEGFEGDQSVSLTGEPREINLTITVKQKKLLLDRETSLYRALALIVVLLLIKFAHTARNRYRS